MTTHEIEMLAEEVEQLDSASARRVARLVLECRASLRDALAAVRMADTAATAPQAHRRWRLTRLFTGRRERHVGMG